MSSTEILYIPQELFSNSSCKKESLKETVQNVELIVIAKIIEIGSKPTFGTGLAGLVTQNVRYKILEVLKGNVSEKEIVVEHTTICDPFKGTIKALPDPYLFGNEQKLILLVDASKSQMKVIDVDSPYTTKPYTFTSFNFGILLATDKNRTRIINFLDVKPSKNGQRLL